jgi:hypothetical protein
MASVVILGLGDSKLIGLNTADGYLSSYLESFQSKRAEQKAPCDLGTSWTITKTVTLRVSPCGSPLPTQAWKPVPYSFVIAPSWSNSFSLQPHSCESTRAPPLMDPPHLS